MAVARHPEILWAQRSDKLFLSIELPDAKDVDVNLDADGKVAFSAKAGANEQEYKADLELFEKINVEESKTNKGLRHTIILLTKAEKKWWPRLLKAGGKAPPFIKVDWNKWVDEDEEESAGQFDPDFLRQFQNPSAFEDED